MMKTKIKTIKEWIIYFLRVLLRLLTNVFNVFKIRKNRVLFCSFNGKQYSCNPRAIFEYLVANSNKEIEYVWVFNKPKQYVGLLPTTVKCVRSNSIKRLFYQKTARIIIVNARGKGIIGVRKKQIMIQTWHASNGYKKLSNLKGVKLKESNLFCKDIGMVLCGCENMKKERFEKTFNYYGEIIKGTPRMDKLVNHTDSSDIKRYIFGKYNIGTTTKVILYAPTYRNGTINDYGLDYERLLTSIKRRFGGNWVILIRLHYFVQSKLKEDLPYFVIDATSYPDIQDLMLISDILISDYSSCVWDFSFLSKPIFLFCCDLDLTVAAR